MYKILAKTVFVGKKIIFLPSCHSTNEVTSSFLENGGLPEGTIVVTNKQTAGRGQRGNTWESEPEKNLTFSTIFKPDFVSLAHQFQLNIVVSLGILDALNTIKEGFQVKWPNDIYYGNKKICGILIQNSIVGKKITSTLLVCLLFTLLCKPYYPDS